MLMANDNLRHPGAATSASERHGQDTLSFYRGLLVMGVTRNTWPSVWARPRDQYAIFDQ
jgi:hypothetical protein